MLRGSILMNLSLSRINFRTFYQFLAVSFGNTMAETIHH